MVHTENLNLTTAIFDNGVRQTYFSGSYLELRDRPASVAQPDFYERLDFFSDKRLNLTTMTTTEFAGLKLNGLLDCQKIQANIISVLGGEITNIGYPAFSHSAAPKSYVDSRAPDWLTAIGTTQASVKLGGFENDMTNKRIINVATPTASTDAATKAYADSLVVNLANLTSIVNKLSTAPASDNANFWNSLRREKTGTTTTLVFLYYIPTAYIVGGTATKITLSGVEYYMPRLTHSTITIDPTFTFATSPLSTGAAGYEVILPGASSTDTTAWRQFLLNNISSAGFVWRRFS